MPVNQEKQHSPYPVKYFLLTCFFFLATASSQPIVAGTPDVRSLKSQLLAIDPLRDHIRGNIDAEFSLIEYADFDCPYCRRFHPAAKQLIKTSGGNNNWVYRHFPHGAHQASTQKLAEAAECVAELGDKNAFWYFTDSLIMQPKRGRDSQNNAEKNLPTGVEKAAKLTRIDSSALAACIDSGRHTAKVQADTNNALQMGLIGTPASIIINNRTGQLLLRQGAASLKTLKADIARLSAPAIAQ
jgi:protein-disulfide isomerase